MPCFLFIDVYKRQVRYLQRNQIDVGGHRAGDLLGCVPIFCFIGIGFFLHRHAAPFLTFRWSGSVPAARKEKRMYFDAKEFGKRLRDVRTSRGITQEELSTIAKKI